MTSEERRKEVETALERLSPVQDHYFRTRLETAEPPLIEYNPGQAAFVVGDPFVIRVGDGIQVFNKFAFLAEAGDVWRYGLFAVEDTPDPQRPPRGQPFRTSKRNWKGARDPELTKK
jgi:hypothetical protein